VAAFHETMAGGVGDIARALRQGIAGGVVDQIPHIRTEVGQVLADTAEERRSAAVVKW